MRAAHVLRVMRRTQAAPAAPILPTIALPPTPQNFWSLIKSTGYAGAAVRVQRSSDNAEQDIGFDNNQMADAAAILAFVGGGTGYVKIVYDQVGNVNQIQSTQSLMPIIAQGGAVIKTASGLIGMLFNGGRYMLAAGAFTPIAGQDFSVSALCQNNIFQDSTSTTNYSPIIGGSTAAGIISNRWGFMLGQRGAYNRSSIWEAASVTNAFYEVTGLINDIAAQTTNLVSINCQTGALAGGPGAGSTLYYQRGKLDNGTTTGTYDNVNHSPAAMTSITDVRLGAVCISTWTTNSVNGSSAIITYAYVGAAMTDASRQAFEKAVISNCSTIIGGSMALPALGSTGEVWDFTTYAADKVLGAKGNADLHFDTAANGSAFSLTTPVCGIPGLYEGTTTNWHNDYEASNTLGWDARSFTMWAIVTMDDVPSQRVFDFIGHGTGTLGVSTGRFISSLLSKDHSPLTAYALDNSQGVTSDYTDMLVGMNDAQTGAAAWLLFSPFFGGGFLGVNVGAHDNNSDHPPFYSKKHFLGSHQTDDTVKFEWTRNYPFMIIMKHTPHPNYDFTKPFNDPWNVLWRNKATTICKAAPLGGLDGFGKIPGGILTHTNRSATAINNNTSRIRHYGGELSSSFKGWSHAAGFISRVTTDAEDQAMFYHMMDPTNVAALAAA